MIQFPGVHRVSDLHLWPSGPLPLWITFTGNANYIGFIDATPCQFGGANLGQPVTLVGLGFGTHSFLFGNFGAEGRYNGDLISRTEAQWVNATLKGVESGHEFNVGARVPALFKLCGYLSEEESLPWQAFPAGAFYWRYATWVTAAFDIVTLGSPPNDVDYRVYHELVHLQVFTNADQSLFSCFYTVYANSNGPGLPFTVGPPAEQFTLKFPEE